MLSTSKISQIYLRNIEHVCAIKNRLIRRRNSCPASTSRSGGCHFEKFAQGSNWALFFQAMQWRSVITFPESWHDYAEQYFRSFFYQRTGPPILPNWRYWQNCDMKKWQVWIWEAFISRILASSGTMDGWHCWQNIQNWYFFASMPRNWYTMSSTKPKL